MTIDRVAVRVTAHAVDRAEDKFGISPTDAEWTAAVTDIFNGRSVCMIKNGTYETHLVLLGDTPVKMVIDLHTMAVITLLTIREGNKRVRAINRRKMRFHPPGERRASRSQWRMEEMVE